MGRHRPGRHRFGWQRPNRVSDHVRKVARMEPGPEEGEVPGEVQLVAPRSVVRGQAFHRRYPGLAEEQTRLVVAIGERAPPTDDVVNLGPVPAESETLMKAPLLVRVLGTRSRIVTKFAVVQECLE